MKELSIEQKAKAYDEALERAKDFMNGEAHYALKKGENIMCWIFPELRKSEESEDERIRKFLIQMARNGHGGDKDWWNKCVAWLEKQDPEYKLKMLKEEFCEASGTGSEQKPADKVEPKFHEGDWIINSQGTLRHIINVDKGGYQTDGGWLTHDTYEKTFHLWTIQDAKDGDVLSFNDGHGNNCIELIKSITDKKIEFWFCLTNGNRYEVFDGITPYTNLVSREDATPATKEQRDTLKKAMADAGYTFDFEKKELRKIEQKTTWSEEDEVSLVKALAFISNTSLKDVDEIKESVLTWLKSIKDRVQPQPQWKPSDAQIKICKEVYADILSAKGFDLDTVNSELNRLEEQLKKLKE